MESNQVEGNKVATREVVIKSTRKGLNSRQWWLHDFLERQAMFLPNKWWTQEEIIKECKKPVSEGGYADYQKDGYMNRHTLKSHEVCASVSFDYQAICDSDEADTIVMLEGATYKMPSSIQEGDEYLERTKLKRALKGMQDYWSQKKKLHRDGQYKLFANSGRLMPEGDEQAAERFVTSYIRVLSEKDKAKKEAKKNGAKKDVQSKGS